MLVLVCSGIRTALMATARQQEEAVRGVVADECFHG